ncbi:unnamed protein product [Adineta steineri]|uniref:Tautomerase cis-CaaD-like domain-containing protein n=1 Tax=Adineta steineri TaxID=433720 RepID=A0A814UEZ4_9BILA|nr:unnamed protein product [Adineta steineri]CAF1173207.1 unnamed protein product [Adineta steineri]CAF3834858.1 unnamed protein product [Adineta steineri]CAF4074092.1 unnamed protein product [Adineta steineri]
MPLYIIEHPAALLNIKQKEQICKEITRIHCDITSGLPSFVNVVFHTTDDNVEFVNNKLRHKSRIIGNIRADRSAEAKEALINQINDAWFTIVGERCHFIALNEVKSENIAEDGIMLPASGKELEWLAKHMKTFEERAEKGEETSQDLLADLKAIQSKT